MSAPLAPLSLEERAIISRVVDDAPPLRPAIVSDLAALFAGVR
ncbi:hypothetical protein [Microbacterium aoyamense]|nr:hypothetical protein [Microbacterium aoyamense]